MPSRREVIGGSLGLAGAVATQGRAAAVSATTTLEQRLDADLRAYAMFGNKNSASPGDLGSAEWIGKSLSDAGYKTTRPDFPVPTFTPDVAELRMNGRTIAVAPQPVVVPTPATGLTAPGVLVRDEYDARTVQGRIAFMILPYGRHASIFAATVQPLLDAIAHNGAKAIVIVTTGPTGSIVGLNTRLKPMAAVPIALMAPRDLPAVAENIANGQSITLILTGISAIRKSCNVIARRVAGPKWLAFSTPRSGWGPCVGERGPGTAAFLELCRWAAVRYPQHSIFAINSGGHELDFAGTHHSLNEGPPAADTLIWTHLGAGLATRDAVEVVRRDFSLTNTADPQRVMMVSPALMAIARVSFRGLVGYEDPIEVVGGAGELSSIIKQGYDKAFAGLGIHRWCHVDSDTLDKVDASLLAPVVEAHQAVIEAVIGQSGSASAQARPT
jgi:hypothetical protein